MAADTTRKEVVKVENVQMVVKDGKLHIEVDLNKDLGISASGKSRMISSTKGNVKIPGTDALIGLNVYKKVG